MNEYFKEKELNIDSLAIFSNLKKDPVIANIKDLFSAINNDQLNSCITIYSNIISALYKNTSNISDYITTLVLEDENFYITSPLDSIKQSHLIKETVYEELDILESLANIRSRDIKAIINYNGFLPSWENSQYDLKKLFKEKMNNISKTGYGIFSKYTFFRLNNGEIVPISFPEFETLDQLFGYERERNIVIKNTKALMDGCHANNILLYGDAGTGKSSTVKAITAKFSDQGLRIIEVNKNDLHSLPLLIEKLSKNPLKFIIFIDDLSFSNDDDNFATFKATIEGSLCGKRDNLVIYATSNRRNLIKETYSDRIGDEIHLNDTLQESMSLAARFGITVTFQRPDKKTYLEIVSSLASEYNISIEIDELHRKAEAFAIRKNGRSPRTAKQFLELLQINI